MTILINGLPYQSETGGRLIDVLNRSGVELSQVCYHPQLGPIQTCDTCLVEVNGAVVRACGTAVSPGMAVSTVTPAAQAARTGSIRPNSQQPHALLHGLRQQQRQLHRP